MISKREVLPAIAGALIAFPLSLGLMQWRSPAPIEAYVRTASHYMVKAGDIVTISWTEHRTNYCDSVVYRRLIAADNSVTFFEPMYEDAKPIGDEIHGFFKLKIPPGLKDGPLIYRVNTEFRCNAIQRFLGGHKFIMPDIVFMYRS